MAVRAHVLLGALLLGLVAGVVAVDRSKFRTCATTGFCSAYRKERGPALFEEPPGALALENGALRTRHTALDCLATGAIRVRIEKGPARWQTEGVLVNTATVPFEAAGSGEFECAKSSKVRFEAPQGKLVFTRNSDSKPYLILNERGMTYVENPPAEAKALPQDPAQETGKTEARRTEERKIVDWGEDGKPIYEDADGTKHHDESQPSEATPPQATDSPTTSRSAPETFGGFTDNKPRGPMSVGFDATFYDEAGVSVSLHGLPEHATAFSLKDTDGSSGAYSEPFRLYNLDVFEYELDQPMALYGSVPYLLSRDSTDRYAGIFFNNPSEIFVDISTPNKGERATRWVAETGILDIFVYPGKSMEKILDQHTQLTGRPYLPPIYSLGYHQCRWNYRDQKDVEEVHAKFEELDFPVDVIWLDIEHTVGKKYFTWDLVKFPDPVKMQDDLKRTGRRMVTIVDPHVKREPGYFVHNEATEKGYYLKDGTNDLEGWCWPGSSSYPDFTSPKVREWWGTFYARYEGSTDRLGTWIDMNEMSLFNGPEVTMKKTALNLEGIEHREWHNLYGFFYNMATFDGIRKAREAKRLRPFILTRSFFAGTQRLGAIWNGDNKADWGHLKGTPAMLLAMSVAGLHFVGGDVGGFFGNPDTELLVRWYESGAFQPFFRAHAHIETKRREPWLFGDDALQQIRAVVMERYRHLPYIYTVFEESSRTGMPVMRPVFGAFSGKALEEAWLLGGDLLVMPIVDPGVTRLYVMDVPHQGDFVDMSTGKRVLRGAQFDAPLGKTPVFQRVGSIIPKQMRLRRSAELMIHDPYTLYVALDDDGNAKGSLYLDDQNTFRHEQGEKLRVNFSVSNCGEGRSGCVLNGSVEGSEVAGLNNVIERVVFVGGSPSKLGCASGRGEAKQRSEKTDFAVECKGGEIVWRKPWVEVTKPFELKSVQ